MKLQEFKSSCRACAHKHQFQVCNWPINKTGRLKLKLVHGESKLWGISQALHQHLDMDGEEDVVVKQRLNIYENEVFEYEQEVDCGCRLYIPSDNLEFVEWKYSQSE